MDAYRWRSWLCIGIAALLLGACQRSVSVPPTESAAMPEDFLGLVSYADATRIREWQQQGIPFVILDVRTEQEFVEDGHAPGSVLQPYYLGSGRRNKNVDFLDQVVSSYPPDTRLLVMCARGVRATRAAWELQTLRGFSDVHVFPGGYEGYHEAGYGSGDGWKAAGLPVVPADD